MRPGRFLWVVSRILCSDTTREQIIESLLADFQHEVLEAQTSRQRAHAWLRGVATFWQALCLCGVHACVRAVVRLMGREILRANAGALSMALAAVAGLLIARHVIVGKTTVDEALTAASGALLVGPAVAMGPAMQWAQTCRRVSIGQAARLTIFWTALSVVAAGWVGPWVQRQAQVRALDATHPSAVSLEDPTFAPLHVLLREAFRAPADARPARRELTLRAAIVATGVLFAAIGWTMRGVSELWPDWPAAQFLLWIPMFEWTVRSFGDMTRHVATPPDWIIPLVGAAVLLELLGRGVDREPWRTEHITLRLR